MRLSRELVIESAPTPPIAAALPFVGCHPLVGFETTDTGSAIVLFG